MNKANYKFFFFSLVIFLLSSSIHSNPLTILDNLEIDEGFEIEIFAENINTPRQIAESAAGNIFVGSRNGGIITSIDENGNQRIIANNLSKKFNNLKSIQIN